MITPTCARRIVPMDVAVSLAGITLLAVWEAFGWDLYIVGLYGDPGGFAWRDHWLTREVLHNAGRWLAAACLFAVAWDACKPLVDGPSVRQRRYWLVVLAGSLVLVPLLKRVSATSCPWDLALFGGDTPYVPYWMPGVVDSGPGHCFPAGHPVAAFAFFATCFLWRPYRPILARWLTSIVLIIGAAFTWAQLARGAHFLAHSGWSAWLCWTFSVVARRFAPADFTRR